MSNFEVSGNTLDGYNRAYSRGLLIVQASGYGLGSLSEGYVHDNIVKNMHAPNQIVGENIAVYKNKISSIKNVCGPGDPTGYCIGGTTNNPPTCTGGSYIEHAGESAYYGDTDCQEECVYNYCPESASWGRESEGAPYRGTGQGLVTSVNGQFSNFAIFQNTWYGISESSIQVRNLGESAVNNNALLIHGNIFANDAILAVGSYSDYGDYWVPTNQPGDSDPPGSSYGDADCSIFVNEVNSDHISNSEIKNNVFYTNGVSDYFCLDNTEFEGFYTTSELDAEGTGSPGTWTTSELDSSDNVTSNPLMVDPGNDDFTLQSASPAKDRGFWTTVSTATSTTDTVQVGNALFLGAPGETIKTAAGVTGTIRSINYTTNTLTLTGAISVVNGEGIGLDYHGTSLDAGAIEYE